MSAILLLDEEQLELVTLSADFYLGALAARGRRMNPDDLITKTLDVSKAKLLNIIEQSKTELIVHWTDLPEDRKSDILVLAQQLLDAPGASTRDLAYGALVALLLTRKPIAIGPPAPNRPRT